MIDVQRVTKVHVRGQTQVYALREVSCQIPAGSFSFILGPSGSGKSTLLYLIGSLDEPTQGEIFVNGRSLKHFSSKEKDAYRRNDVGFIFQSFNLLANLNAVDNVLVPYLAQGVSRPQRHQAIELLEKVGLKDRLDHLPSQLSGGEQQRVAIARALLKRPKLILADEPTGELDTTNSAAILEELRKCCSDFQTTVVVVTHEHEHVRETDHIVRIRDGQLNPAAR